MGFFFVVTQPITVIIFIIMPFSICLMELMSHFVNHWPIFLPCLSNRQPECAEIRLFSRHCSDSFSALCVLIDWLLNSASPGKMQEGLNAVSHHAGVSWCFWAELGCSTVGLVSLAPLLLPRNASQGMPCRVRDREAALCTGTSAVPGRSLLLFSHVCDNIDNYQLPLITACGCW